MRESVPVSDREMRCGFVAIVGRPNVGKSTLLNTLLERKVTIVAPKPQTTRHRIAGILTTRRAQVVFLDTPGLHRGAKRAMNRYMNRAAAHALAEADIALFVIVALEWTEEDQDLLERLERAGTKILLIVNKVDTVKPKARLLPFLEEASQRGNFLEIFPISALRKDNVAPLVGTIIEHLPVSPPVYPSDQLTDRSEAFQAAEIIREKLTLALAQELPYGLTVEIERYEREEALLRISAIIWVERRGQKAIVIGKRGEQLKRIGRAARLELEAMTGGKVHLELWVKIKENWSDSERALRQLGYDTE